MQGILENALNFTNEVERTKTTSGIGMQVNQVR